MKNNKVSLLTAILLNINLMVGAGMYINTPLMTQKAGSFSYMGWALSALILLPIVVCITQISKLFPQEGSFYNYSKNGLGKTMGFLSGWVYFLGYVAIQSTQMIAMRDILIYQLNMHWIKANIIPFNILFFGSLFLISLFNLTAISKIQNFVTFIKIIPVVIVVFAIMFFSSSPANLTPTPSSSMWNLHYTLPLAIFGYWGFEGSASISHRIKGPSHNASRSMVIGYISTVTIFTLFHFGLLQIMGAENLSMLGTTAFPQFLPLQLGWFIKLLNTAIPIIIILTFINCIYAEITSFSFLLHAMAKERLLFLSDTISKSNKNNQPVFAIFIQVFLAFLFVTFVNNKNILVAISNLGLLTAFLLTLVSLLIIHKRQRAGFTKTIAQILGFASCIVLGYYSYLEIGKMVYALAFIAVVVIGLIMFKIQERKINV